MAMEMENTTQSDFKVSDFGLITALYALGFKVSNTERQGRRIYFYFSGSDDLRTAVDDYWSGQLEVSAKHYSECSKVIKSWLYGY